MASPFRRSRANSRTNAVEVEQDVHIDNYLRELTNPINANIDIVAVHGLNFLGKTNHGADTWTKNGVLWLQDEKFLPARFPLARTMLFSYNSRVMSGTSTASVMDVATELLNRLKHKRRDHPNRPILFLCHSLGGIIVKQALVRAEIGTKYKEIQKATKSIAFFGTPHRGGRGADLGTTLASISLLFTGSVKNNFMETLQKGSTSADTIQEMFKDQAIQYKIVSFFETLPYKSGPILIVERRSATLGLPDLYETAISTAADHSEMCKFDRRDDRYEIVIENIADLVHHALRRDSLGLPALTPAISLTDPQDRQRTLSIGSFQSSSGPSPGSAWNSSQESLHLGMPTFGEGEYDQNQQVAYEPVSGPVTIMPFGSNPDFIGRERIFESIKNTLEAESNGQRRVALYGMGGVGKSQLAVRYAYWYRQRYPDHSIFWIHCGTAERFEQGLINIGMECHVPGIYDRNKDRLRLIRDWFQRQTDFKWLMILDNADELHSVPGSSGSENLSTYIPNCEFGSVLVTTRDLIVGRQLANGKPPIQIGKMSQSEAVAMLRTRLSARIDTPISPLSPASYQQPVHDTDLLELAQALDYLPLAMAQAAGFIVENSLSVRRYIQMFSDDTSAVELLQQGVQESGRISDVPNSVYATWKLSITQIQDNYPKSADLIFLMAHYEQVQIPVALLRHQIGSSAVESAAIIGVLLRFSLIVNGRQDTYNMHRLIQLVVKQWLEAANAADEWQSKALRLLSTYFPNGEYETWVTCAALEAHAVKMIHTSGMKDSDRPFLGTLQMNLAWYLSTRGRWAGSEEHIRGACLTLQEHYGLRHRDTLVAKSKLAFILKQNGKISEAEVTIRQVIDESKALLGTKDELYLDAIDTLAVIAQTLGRLGEAEKLARRALAGREKLLGPNHPKRFQSLRRLATILEFAGRHNDAEVAIRQALDGQKHLIGTGDRTTIQIMQRLSFILESQGKYAEAEDIARQYYEAQLTAYGPTHIETQEALYSFGSTLASNNKSEEAEKIFLGQVDFINKHHPFSETHQFNFYIQSRLGKISYHRGDYDVAVKYFEVAWKGIQHTYKNHMKSYEYQSWYAAALLRSDPVIQRDTALRIQQEACAGLERILGAEHPSTCTATLHLSEAYAGRGDFAQASKLAKKALRGREKRLNPGHPYIAAARSWLAEVDAKNTPGASKIASPLLGEPARVDKPQKKRRSWGLKKLLSNSDISVEFAGHDIGFNNGGIAVTNKMLEKSAADGFGLDEKDSTSHNDANSPRTKDAESGSKDATRILDVDSDSESDLKDNQLDYEKSAAYTTQPSRPPPALPLRSVNPAAPSTDIAVPPSDKTENDKQTLSRKRSEAMARAIEECDRRRKENKAKKQVVSSQSWPRESNQESSDSASSQIRRKPIASGTSSHPIGRQETTSVDGGELPAEVPVNPAARLDGPGWDDGPFLS